MENRENQILPKESQETLKKLRLDEVKTACNNPSQDPYKGKQKALFETWRKAK
jgi:hypothetical protein